MPKKGEKMSPEQRAKISQSASKRIRTSEGTFITKEKETLIYELAEKRGIKQLREDVQSFYNQNEKTLEGWVKRGEVEATFSTNNYAKYLTNNFNKFYVNNISVTRLEIIYIVAQVQNYLFKNYDSIQNIFHGITTDVTNEGAQTLSVILPVVQDKNGNWRVSGEKVEELIDSEDIEVTPSPPRKESKEVTQEKMEIIKKANQYKKQQKKKRNANQKPTRKKRRK
jgi:hypothetical protein